MNKGSWIAAVAFAAGAGTALLPDAIKTQAADEIRCRVNVEAFLADLNAATTASQGGRLPSHADRDALQKAIDDSKRQPPKP